jgi:hypothetical protein
MSRDQDITGVRRLSRFHDNRRMLKMDAVKRQLDNVARHDFTDRYLFGEGPGSFYISH